MRSSGFEFSGSVGWLLWGFGIFFSVVGTGGARQRKKWSKLLGSVWTSVSKFSVTQLKLNPERSRASAKIGRCLCVRADLCLRRCSQRAARREFCFYGG